MLNEIEIITALKNKHEQCFSSSRVPKQNWFGIRPSRSCTAGVLGIFGMSRQEVYSAYLNANGFNHDNSGAYIIKQNQLISAPIIEAYSKIKIYQQIRKSRYFGIGVSDNDVWNIFCEELKYRLSEIAKLQDYQIIMNELTLLSIYINEILFNSNYLFPQENVSPNSIGEMLHKISKDVELASSLLFSLEQDRLQFKLLNDITLLGKAIISESFSVLTILCSNKSQQDNAIISCIERLRNCSAHQSNIEQLLMTMLDTSVFKSLFPVNQLQAEAYHQASDNIAVEYSKAVSERNPLIVFDTTELQKNIFSIRKDIFKLRFDPTNIIVIYGEFARKILIDLTQWNSGVENILARDNGFLKKVMILIGFLYEFAKVLVLSDKHVDNSFYKDDALKFLKLVDLASYLIEVITQTMNVISYQCTELYNAAMLHKPYQTTDQHIKFTHVNVSQEWQKNHVVVSDKIKHLLKNLSELRNKIEQLKQVIFNGMPQDIVKQLYGGDKILAVDCLNENSISCHHSLQSFDQTKRKDTRESDQDVADVMRLNMMMNIQQDLTNRAASGGLDDRGRAEYLRLDQQIEQLESSLQHRYKSS